MQSNTLPKDSSLEDQLTVLSLLFRIPVDTIKISETDG